MAVNRGCSLVFVGLLGVLSVGVAAQSASTLTVEQNKLARIEQALENRQVELEDIENEILAYEYKLERAEKSLSDARAHYQQSMKELKTAEREHKTSPSSDTERALHKARHGFKMAERGVDSRNRRVEFIQSTYGELQARMKKTSAAVADIKQRQASQKKRVDATVQSMLVEAKQRKAEKAAEIAAEAKRQAQAPVGAPEVPQPTQASLTPVQPEVPPAKQAEVREIDPDLMEYVQGELERLDKLLADNEGEDMGKHTFRNLTLRTSGGETLDFEFLGHNQYRLVTPVEAGRQTYKVNNWKFRRTIPSDDDGTRYVFVFDARRLARPRLVMYPEYVLSQLD